MEKLKRLFGKLGSLGALAMQHLKLLGIATLATLYIVSIFKIKEQKKLLEKLDALQVLMTDEGIHEEEFDSIIQLSHAKKTEKQLTQTKYLLFHCQNKLDDCKSSGKSVNHHNKSDELPSHKNRNKPSQPKALARKNLTV